MALTSSCICHQSLHMFLVASCTRAPINKKTFRLVHFKMMFSKTRIAHIPYFSMKKRSTGKKSRRGRKLKGRLPKVVPNLAAISASANGKYTGTNVRARADLVRNNRIVRRDKLHPPRRGAPRKHLRSRMPPSLLLRDAETHPIQCWSSSHCGILVR